MTPYDNIIQILKNENISYKEIEHEAVKTCEESAIQRKNAGLEGTGSKNVFMKASKSGRYFLAVTLAGAQIGKKQLKPVMGEKDFRFSDAEELKNFMGVESGCVYPFGHDKEILTLVDEEIFQHEFFLFNPALHTKSIQIATSDLKKIYEKYYPNLLYFSTKEEA